MPLLYQVFCWRMSPLCINIDMPMESYDMWMLTPHCVAESDRRVASQCEYNLQGRTRLGYVNAWFMLRLTAVQVAIWYLVIKLQQKTFIETLLSCGYIIMYIMGTIVQSDKSHNVSDTFLTRHFVKKMWQHFCYKVVCCGIWDSCVVGFLGLGFWYEYE